MSKDLLQSRRKKTLHVSGLTVVDFEANEDVTEVPLLIVESCEHCDEEGLGCGDGVTASP